MKKVTSFSLSCLLLVLCGCAGAKEINSSTRFVLNTVATIDAECDKETLNEAFKLCESYEKIFSRTVSTSDVARLNNTNGFVSVSDDTRLVIERSLYYGKLSGGAFDITICPISNLWDFEGTALPDKKEIAEAIKNVDYESIKIDGNSVNLCGKQIDLGGIAKGYIADKLLDFFKDRNIESGIINLGGNVTVFGDELKNVGIRKPFTADGISAAIRVKNKTVVTSGIYQRYIEKNGTVYHHILDKNTGYGVETDLYSATVIGESSVDCDALATVCILKGKSDAERLIEKTKDVEAVFIDKDENITYTSGLKYKNNTFTLK